MEGLLCILVFSLIGGSSSQLAGYGRGGGGGGGGRGGSSGGGGGGGGGGFGGGGDGGGSLEDSIPGVPGQDYPIYAQVPDTGFSCDGQVDGGKYGDPAAECQVFHICTADGEGGLSTYSFLCPNGTIFNQQYFICDWWFNFDCSQTQSLYGLNDQIAAEAASISGGGGGGGQGGGAGGRGGGSGGRGGGGGGGGGALGTGYGAPGR